MHYLHKVFNKFMAILNILTMYKQASSKSSACSNIRPFVCSAVITSYVRRLLWWTTLFSTPIAKLYNHFD